MTTQKNYLFGALSKIPLNKSAGFTEFSHASVQHWMLLHCIILASLLLHICRSNPRELENKRKQNAVFKIHSSLGSFVKVFRKNSASCQVALWCAHFLCFFSFIRRNTPKQKRATKYRSDKSQGCESVENDLLFCSIADPDPSDPYVFGPPGFGCSFKK